MVKKRKKVSAPTYIKLNTKYIKIAAILKGLAAIFISTKFYVFVIIYAKSGEADCVNSRRFGFSQVDSHCFSPGCRSPPS